MGIGTRDGRAGMSVGRSSIGHVGNDRFGWFFANLLSEFKALKQPFAKLASAERGKPVARGSHQSAATPEQAATHPACERDRNCAMKEATEISAA
jgi:hypothetical protein